MPPDVSVVIPTYRRPVELAEALASVLRQEGVTVEAFVVDDCPDGSARAVVEAAADPRVTYLADLQPSGGRPALLRNRGLHHATGELIHFLDDDDIVPDGHYRAVKAVFDVHRATNVVFGLIDPFGLDTDAVASERTYFTAARRRALRCRRYGRLGFAAALLFRPTVLVCGAAMLRRSCLPALGGFDATLPLCEDVEFYARAIRRYGVRFVDRSALRYRIGPSLMHRPERGPVIAESYAAMHRAYRARHGRLDFTLLKLFALTARI